jgi:hypothetical protein
MKVFQSPFSGMNTDNPIDSTHQHTIFMETMPVTFIIIHTLGAYLLMIAVLLWRLEIDIMIWQWNINKINVNEESN